MGTPPKHTQFKPGQSGNVNGRPKGILRADDVRSVLGKFWNMTRDELQKVIQNQKSTMGEIMVASIMARAAKDGDASRLSMLLDRAIGRVKLDEVSSDAIIPEMLNLLQDGGVGMDQIVAHLVGKKA